MIKEDVLQYLKDEFYLVQQGNGWVISNKFTRELGISSNHTIPFTPKSVVDKPVLGPGITSKEVYKKFIQDAAVPSKIDTSNGAYWANRYSETGFKAFKKVFDNPKINRAILLAATKWYYAQSRTARKMIGTYFSEGIWESCYDDFVRAKQQQTTGSIKLNNPAVPKIVDENASNMEQG